MKTIRCVKQTALRGWNHSLIFDLVACKDKDELKAKEPKPPIVNQQNVVYFFKCDLCDADYVGFTSRHLHQRVEEHKRSVIGNHVREQHGNEPCEIAKNFRVLRKCSNKFDCLIFEMLFIRDLNPKY